MNLELTKRVLILFGVVAALITVLMLLSYDVIKIEWISFMEIQPAFKPMEQPLPVPAHSIPVEGAAYVPGLGSPENPIAVDDVSLARGKQLYEINCAQCHGFDGLGNGTIGAMLNFKPANLIGDKVKGLADGAIFLTISNGVAGRMPALNENLYVRDRWDVVNYVRWLQQQPPAATP
jgi:mono/diheme cytochrome c family protein